MERHQATIESEWSPGNTERDWRSNPIFKDNYDLLDETSIPVRRGGETVLFVEFYDEIWPRKIGRGAARKAWDSVLKRAVMTEEALCDAAARWALAYDKAGTPAKFIPHPATWLNQERFRDHPEVPNERP